MYWGRCFSHLAILAVLTADGAAQAQPAPAQRQAIETRDNVFLRFFRDGEWYFSWGYNKEYWAPTDIRVSQPSQGNDFVIRGVRGHDEAGFGFTHDLTVGQFNIRISRFVDDARTIGVELSIDHTKYTSTLGQTAQVTGVIGGLPINANRVLDANFFSELLHNGANHLMVNAVYRFPLIGQINETFSVAAIGKAGAGLMMPHTWNRILGQESDVGQKVFGNLIGLHSGWWQFNGWTAGLEAGLRFVLWNPVYLELTNKVAYSQLSNLPAYQGTLRHSLIMHEVILSLGFTYDGTSRR